MKPAHPQVQTLETINMPLWGEVTHLKIATPEYTQLTWVQVWQAFTAVYPDRWAIELYPPVTDLVNEARVYHLWMLPEAWRPPQGMNLAQKYRG
ncbi:MAG: hypothetical protein HC804_02325 [Anaerolineae bacterium]|nr:hypothetical protein [Anaerolineae bacterium]